MLILSSVARARAVNEKVNPLDATRIQKEAGHCNMHHEVLLALSGYPGHTFAVSRESGLFEVLS